MQVTRSELRAAIEAGISAARPPAGHADRLRHVAETSTMVTWGAFSADDAEGSIEGCGCPLAQAGLYRPDYLAEDYARDFFIGYDRAMADLAWRRDSSLTAWQRAPSLIAYVVPDPQA